jgi:hypothetical protein
MAIAERMPEVGRRFYNNVVAYKIARLAAYLDTRTAAGDLDIEDCQLAATAERIAEVVESATRMFLAGYQAKSA